MSAVTVLLRELPADLRLRMLVGTGALIVLVGVLLFFAARNARVNRARRASGRSRLSAAQIATTRMSAARLTAASDDEVAEALALARQKEWEQERAGQEMAKYGRSMVRGYCRVHDRWGKYPERGPHPPGGFDNERAPASWKPIGEDLPPSGR
jgi:hypothetical protein